MADKETKKQIPLRLSAKLYDALAAWAEDDFRSVNGQIEYLLTECVRHRRKEKEKEKENFSLSFLLRSMYINNKLYIKYYLFLGYLFLLRSIAYFINKL